ncbi:hypothetical protein ml_522 [Mollivirus sibericum]|uniref:hypothetical protein n=1 Tax=Mollivirus sibericum TaxID=1678078 RepID=UPI0006B2E9B0|nr:hypothetical protein ml_2 [Mollivirus sibericum]YP_009165488.1 hypothetical protein ml_522 [Mollivirus sibericum]ALD61804.1 hypothetical protein ml_2 [Mollivirus sibericum]ALD62324.1 hypothetical protein ml_522 [Mollivirus sibericum]
MTPSVVMDGQAKPSCHRRLQPTDRAVDLQILGWTDDTVGGDGWMEGWTRPSQVVVVSDQPTVRTVDNQTLVEAWHRQ